MTTTSSTPRLSSGAWPSAGAWREGDPVGDRRFVSVGPVELEAGGRLPDVTVAYETWGTLNEARDNAILVEHALTGDSHVSGPAGPGHATPGWWDGLIGPGCTFDTDRHFVVAANVLGGCQGTTGPASTAPDGRPWGSRFPFVTIRDQVAVEARLAELLGIERWNAVLGGSMGGMRSLEWAVTHPERVETAIVLASTAYATAEQIAWCQPQLLAIRSDPAFHGGDYYERGAGPEQGLGIARRIAHVTYRSELELHERFGRLPQGAEQPVGGGGRYAVESYLDHHAGKIAARFDANSYLVLTEAMNSHDIGRDRGGVAAALRRVTGRLVVASVDSDRLYPPRLSEEIAAAVPHAEHVSITSPYGHDGFLIETEQVGAILRQAVARPAGAEEIR
ncbi:homoserine O-acetyltransferase [Phycicoccus sp. SLBN-51]|uniref:homoserine O-acetyltransferase MetX n=1 Tax=Phycicoccus sp. SLBN-51 TaxID=2768447 RepID=UPI00114DC746|nr:homoserine O-acetyltransferase [Phycicoccus sp. SLBN-51]TQJ50276.1 homoserine O-acetyltransferase [Phycicoccus sp. SLBN-51]